VIERRKAQHFSGEKGAVFRVSGERKKRFRRWGESAGFHSLIARERGVRRKPSVEMEKKKKRE